MNKEQLNSLLKQYGISPRKEQGQNFLIDDEVVQSSVDAADLNKDDVVLEIGPGFGALTTAMVEQAGKVVAIEQDRVLFSALQKLKQQQPDGENLQLINADVRKVNLKELGLNDQGYKLVANLPYSIASWILRQFIEQSPRPSLMVVMVQKEVAERALAKPGKMSVLANAIQCFAKPEIVREVTPQSFYPEPNVTSAILKLVIREQPASADPQQYMKLVKIGFSARRKQLQKNLQAGLRLEPGLGKEILTKIGLRADIRAQDLAIKDWEALRSSLLETKAFDE